MATLENVHLDITPLTTKPGFSRIAYSYELHPGEQDCAEKREYSVKTSLWGEDLIDDDVLALEKDEHRVVFDDCQPGKPLQVRRAFEIETKTLDEDVFGEDEVYLIVEAKPDAAGGDLVMGRSNTVKGDF